MSYDKKSGRRDAGDFDGKPLPDKIGNTLRRLYDDVLSEDVPDDFLNLLKKADENKGEASK